MKFLARPVKDFFYCLRLTGITMVFGSTVVGFTDLTNWQISLSAHYVIVQKRLTGITMVFGSTVVGFTDLTNWQISLSAHYVIVQKI
jgi:hypothetical protein